MYWQIDIKYLTDIDNLKPYFDKNNDRGLMKYQITARDLSTGLPLVAYCNEKSVTYTKMFLKNILYKFLEKFEYLNLKDIKIQTDNGTEFTNKYIQTKEKNQKKVVLHYLLINTLRNIKQTHLHVQRGIVM